MQILVALLIAIFFIFWVGDFVLTTQVIKTRGKKYELNPLVRLFSFTRGKFFFLFKFTELVLFIGLWVYVSTFNSALIFKVLLGYIFFYSLVVLNNATIYVQLFKKPSRVFGIVYILLVVILIVFLLLNLKLYADIQKSYIKYSELRSELSSEINMTSQSAQNIPDFSKYQLPFNPFRGDFS